MELTFAGKPYTVAEPTFDRLHDLREALGEDRWAEFQKNGMIDLEIPIENLGKIMSAVLVGDLKDIRWREEIISDVERAISFFISKRQLAKLELIISQATGLSSKMEEMQKAIAKIQPVNSAIKAMMIEKLPDI